MIVSVIQYGSLLSVRNEQGVQTGTLSMNGGTLLGYSGTFIVLRYGNMIITTDEHQQQLGNVVLPSDWVITGITQNGFLARTGSLIQIYDPWCRHMGNQSV